MKQKRIKWFSTLTIFGLVAFLLYYPYRVLTDIVPFAFTQPDLWQNHWMVHYDSAIPFSLRFGYFALWIVPIVATVIMTAMAIHFFYLLRQGVYFDFRTVRDIQLIGLSACVAGSGVLLGNSLTDWLITFMNTKDRHGIRFGYEPTDMGLALTGVGLFLAGWILKTVVLQDQENKGFV